MPASRRRLLHFSAALALSCLCLHARAGNDAAPAPATAPLPTVTMHTSMGDVTIELYPEKSPRTVANFLLYVKSGFYNGTLFHRVVKGRLIQGGGIDKKMHDKQTRAPVKNEANNGLSNLPMTVAMARSELPDSATSQFFINIGDNSGYDYPSEDGAGYCVFGKVIDGADVLEHMQEVEVTNRGRYDHLPTTQIVIESVKLNKP